MNTLKFNKCIFCGEKHLYIVSSTQYKCSTCKKKFSTKKLQKDFDILVCFCENMSAKETSKTLHVSYKSVKERYEFLRQIIVVYLEEVYQSRNIEFSEYDEYYYLPKNKRGKVKYLFDAIGILGMVYAQSIYTLMLPEQFTHLKEYQEESDVNHAYLKEYARFLNRYKIVHYKKFDNLLISFWVYIEQEMGRFKGVSKENFIYYLKECEFKFNHKNEDIKNILWKLWLKRV